MAQTTLPNRLWRRLSICLFLAHLLPSAGSCQEPPQQEDLTRHPRIGYCVHIGRGTTWPLDKTIDAVKQSGATWIRDDFYWTGIEKTKGVYTWPDEERFRAIDAANAAELKVIAIFNIPASGHPLYSDTNPYDPDAYARAAAWFAKQTRGKVQAIEILNEPYGFGFRQHYGGTWNGVEKDGSNSPWVSKYAELLNKSAKAIKAVNPDVKVIGLGCVAPTNFRLLSLGIAPEVDGIVEHSYSFRTVPEIVPFAATPSILERDGGTATADTRGSFASQVKLYREHSAQHKGPKEFWITEFGWTTYLETGASKYYSGFTESAQAKYTIRRITEALGLGVDNIMIYCLKNKGANIEDAEDNFGVMDGQFNPKPAYGAVRRLAAALADYEPKQNFELNIFSVRNRPDTHPIVWDGAKLAAPGQVAAWQFVNKAGQPMVALWSTERADGDLNPAVADVEIVTTQEIRKIRSYDVFHDTTHNQPFVRKNGRIFIEKMIIPDSPVLLSIE